MKPAHVQVVGEARLLAIASKPVAAFTLMELLVVSAIIALLSQIREPSPARALVFIDEHEGSIENGRLVIAPRGNWVWADFPASRHQNGGVLSRADGHVAYWRWLEPNTLSIARQKGWIQGPSAVPGQDRDLSRVQDGVPEVPVQ